VKRGISLKGLTYGAVEPAAGGTAKQKITIQQGIAIEKAREIVKLVKDSKKKAQASIQGDLVRVSGKDRDTLQEIIALLRSRDFGIDLQFTNYRSN
jgi:cyclic-di-GMP-binding protein